MIKTICETEKCTGCMACMNTCHQNAIFFQQNEEGFLYPVIDSSKCIDCGLCTKVCPVNNPTKKQEPIKVYSGWSNDEKTRINSSSGGAFTEIAKVVLDRHGVVFGCALNEKLQAVHTWIDNIDDIKKLQGSKYVQSQINNSYKQAKEFLKQNRHVLFSGTPCQIAGLKKYLGKDYDNLITVDIICHGVPSPQIFEDYKKYLLNSQCFSDIKNIGFRDKKNSWFYFNLLVYGYSKIDGHLKTYIGTYFNDPYIRGFLRNVFLRPSCYKCMYSTPNRVSDFTIADWWFYNKKEKKDKDFMRRGVSLLLVNTLKALKITHNLQMNLSERTMDEALKTNDNLHKCTQKPINRNDFWRFYSQNCFTDTVKKYMYPEKIKLNFKLLNNFSNSPFVIFVSKVIGKFYRIINK